MLEYIDLNPKLLENSGLKISDLKGRIEFKDVCFSVQLNINCLMIL